MHFEPTSNSEEEDDDDDGKEDGEEDDDGDGEEDNDVDGEEDDDDDGEYDDQIILCFDCGQRVQNPDDRLCIFCKNYENIELEKLGVKR